MAKHDGLAILTCGMGSIGNINLDATLANLDSVILDGNTNTHYVKDKVAGWTPINVDKAHLRKQAELFANGKTIDVYKSIDVLLGEYIDFITNKEESLWDSKKAY